MIILELIVPEILTEELKYIKKNKLKPLLKLKFQYFRLKI